MGMLMSADLSAAVFLPMWISMMAAMMFPTIAPMVLAHRLVTRSRGEGWLPSVAFVAGYLLIWSLIGLVPFAAWTTLTRVLSGSPAYLPWASAAILIGAGIYQLTPFKAICLRHCRTPLAFVIQHDFGGGWRSAVRAGMLHGAYCVGCCWALMSVLLVVGLMNLAWMGVLAAIFLAEKTWRHGVGVTRIVAAALVTCGVAIAIHPGFLVIVSLGRDALVSHGM
jgi:predicted metal-binding membrane protein